MHPWLAKPLDWCVIQLARRCVRLDHSPTPGRPDLNAKLSAAGLTESCPANLPELLLEENGHFQFTSSVLTASAQNNRVYGRLIRAAPGWQTLPTVVLLHGWNAETCYHRMFPYLGQLFCRAGLNTAMLELPYHMQRRPRNGPVTDFISSDLGSMLEATRQAIADIHSLCTWLHASGSGVIGLWGFSLGAWLAGLAARGGPRLRFMVLTTPIASLERAIAELPFCEPVRRSLRQNELDLRELNLSTQAPVVEPRNVLLVESRHDLFAPAATVDQLWRAWGHPEIWRLAHGHISILLSVAVMRRTVAWIQTRTAAAAQATNQS